MSCSNNTINLELINKFTNNNAVNNLIIYEY